MFAEADKLKEQGNQLFKDKKYGVAVEKFKQGTELLENNAKDDIKKPQNEVGKLYINILTNASLCYINMKTTDSYEEAIKVSTKALDIQPDNLKGLYRRGLAHKELGEKLEQDDAKNPRLATLYQKAKEDLEKLTLLDRKNQLAQQKLSQTIKNLYRVRLLAKQQQKTAEKKHDEIGQSKMSEQAQLKAKRQAETMNKILKEYKVEEVTKLAHSKMEDELLNGPLPKNRNQLEKAVKVLCKTNEPFSKFVLRLDKQYLKNINPDFDTLCSMTMCLAQANITDVKALENSFTALSQTPNFNLMWSSLVQSQKKKITELSQRALKDKQLIEAFQNLKLK